MTDDSQTGDSNRPQVTRALIRRAKDGDRAAMDSLLAHIAPLTMAAARKAWPRVRHAYDSEDIHQTVMRRLVRGFGKFDGEQKAQLMGWFRVALRNAQIDIARREDGSPVVSGPDLAVGAAEPTAGDDSPATQAIQSDELTRMRNAVRRLGIEDREILVAHDLELVSFAEIAERQGVTIEVVKKRAQRARKRLRALIERARDTTA